MSSLIAQGPLKLQLLKDGWAFDLFKRYSMSRTFPGDSTDLVTYEPAPWTCSWYHKCADSHYYARTDYIKNINKYFPQGTIPAQIQRGDVNPKGPCCWHCGKLMPTKYVRLFQAFILNVRMRHGREPVKFLKGR